FAQRGDQPGGLELVHRVEAVARALVHVRRRQQSQLVVDAQRLERETATAGELSDAHQLRLGHLPGDHGCAPKCAPCPWGKVKGRLPFQATMTEGPAELYFDLGSPYAYLALERADAVFAGAGTLVPVLVGAIFGWRGHGSWAPPPERASGRPEIERPARGQGVPPMNWPPDWPAHALSAMRSSLSAARERR